MQVNAIPRAPAPDRNHKPQMKIPRLPQLQKGARKLGFTLIELLVVISIIAILAGLAFKAFPAAMKKARLTESLNNCKQIGLSLKMFATDNDGLYPANTLSTDGGATQGTPLAAGDFSNRALETLMPKYAPSKVPFINKTSAYCKGAPNDTTVADARTLRAGQNDWLYITGMTDSSDGRWPLIATATKSAGDLTYTVNKNDLGGVWEGTDAVIGFTDGSAKQIAERDMNISTPTSTTIRGPISANIFVATPDWLGTSAQILLPQPPTN